MPFGCKHHSQVWLCYAAFHMLITLDAFQDMHEASSLQAPATARGPALLDDDDAFRMGEFFNRLGTAETEQHNFTFDDSVDVKGSQMFPWPGELPPTFMGSMTSLEPPLSHSAGSASRGTSLNQDFSSEDANRGGYRPLIEAPDVLAAASSLVHNRHHPRSSELSGRPFANPQAAHLETDALALRHTNQYRNPDPLPPGFYIANHSTGHSNNHKQSTSVLNPDDTVLRDIVLGPSHSSEQSSAITIKHVDLLWGSDQSFFDDGYLPPPHQISVERLTQSLLGKMECLEPQPSATNSRPSSPSYGYPQKRAWDVNTTNSGLKQIDNGVAHDRGIVSVETGPRAKRRKRKADRSTTVSKERDDVERHGGLFIASNSQTRDNSSMGSPTKRRSPKSQDTTKRSRATGDTRPGRTNLTPVQKRENHVRSEQKRREIIKQGFDDLVEMVPGLHGGGFSKGAILTQAADWLEDLVQGNVLLRRQLAQMEDVVVNLEDGKSDEAFS